MSAAEHRGRIMARFGAQLLLEDEQGRIIPCTTRRRLEHAVCNDQVLWHVQEGCPDQGVVTSILPRQNLLERIDGHGRSKRIAANLDQVLVVCAVEPEPNWTLIDRYLLSIELMPCKAVIVFNKADLLDGRTLPAELEEYRQLGYEVLPLSMHSGLGLDSLPRLLAKGTSILVGQSGVGKSSLIKALLPEQDIRIGELSKMGGEGGRHTTTHAQVYPLAQGGSLIDSPGVRDFVPGAMPRERLIEGFVELRELAGQCRFKDCRHEVEPGCAIREALEQGRISRRRYQSYLNLANPG